MEEIRLKALAKINLGLDVVRRREDGYHEVRMIMQTVQMYDQITIHQMDKPGIKAVSYTHLDVYKRQSSGVLGSKC